MFLYGVVNASPDSLNTDSIATTPDAATRRGEYLLNNGCQGIDLGGQGSTDNATVIPWTDEWARLADIVKALAAFGVPLSIDSWKPEVTRLALQSGATVINAADGMQTEEMWRVAADFSVPIVLPFLSGPNPRQMELVRADPIGVMIEFFEEQLRIADRFGLRANCILDPGTGFAPSNWPWEERYLYQKHVYSNLVELRRFGLPLYIALPWKETAQHDELLEIVLAQRPEYGRAHYPAKIRRVEAALGLD
ncbi:MAG: dihydropteroate synthase [Actinomycetota bacterium]|jgi:dihydropteroate synthase